MPDRIDQDRRRFLGRAAASVAAARFVAPGAALQQLACAEGSASAASALPSLGEATGWLNSPPLTPADLHGKVVLIHFWTYTCINWLRSLPFVRAWAEKYGDRGLVVVGVHAPEFAFERDVANVRRAAAQLRVAYPIAVDNDYAIWRAFGNAFWPALYLIDAQGRLRYRHFGEGEYDRSEWFVRRLLTETGVGDIGDDRVRVSGRGIEADADWGSLRSPEMYLGHARAESFASTGGAAPDERRVYAAPARLALDQWALSGDWTVGGQAVTLHAADGRITCRFHARDLHLVMGPAAPGASARYRVLVDGRPPGAAHGLDVDDGGNGVATEQRLYQLIRQPKPITERHFEVAFLDPAVQAFAFTFG